MTAIRPATRADLPACARVVHDWERATGYIHDTPDLDTLTGYILEAFPAREIHVTGEPVTGYISIDPAEAKVGALYLLETGQGTGKRLMDRAKKGRDHLWLTVYLPNLRAQAFYAREGFTTTAELPPDREGAPAMLRMEWHR